VEYLKIELQKDIESAIKLGMAQKCLSVKESARNGTILYVLALRKRKEMRL